MPRGASDCQDTARLGRWLGRHAEDTTKLGCLLGRGLHNVGDSGLLRAPISVGGKRNQLASQGKSAVAVRPNGSVSPSDPEGDLVVQPDVTRDKL